MRLKSLSLFLKLNTLKKGLSRRISFFLNICIFFSLFAITSTCISVYFETKINNLEQKISENNLTIDIASLNINLLPKNINTLERYLDEQEKLKDLIDLVYFSKFGIIFSERDKYYLPVLNMTSYLTKGFSDFDIFKSYISGEKIIEIKVDDKILRTTETLSKKKKIYENIIKEINEQHEKNTFTQGGMKTIPDIGENFYKNYNKYYDDFLGIAKDQISFFTQTISIIRKIIDEKMNENLSLRKDISEQSNLSSNLVLLAFVLQLFIFLVIQSLEYQTTRNEINEAGNS